MTFRTLGAKAAAELDSELMSTCAFTLEQLMELAGLSVSQAVYKIHPPSRGKRILLACGPGNNGGDGLVCARHLFHYGYSPTVYYPKQGKNPFYEKLKKQLTDLKVPFTNDFATAIKSTDHIVDAIFGFSFQGEVREPFAEVIVTMKESDIPVLSVDAPSSWDIEHGAPDQGVGKGFVPEALISLTAPKPLTNKYQGRHFIGGRFLSKKMADKFGIDIPPYAGIDQIVEV